MSIGGENAEIANKCDLSIHPKLLNALAIPDGSREFGISLYFDPEGFIYFYVPEPPLRPIAKCNLYSLSYEQEPSKKFYYLLLVDTAKEEDFLKVLKGTEKFNVKDYAYVVASGLGDVPKDLAEQMRAKYAFILESASVKNTAMPQE